MSDIKIKEIGTIEKDEKGGCGFGYKITIGKGPSMRTVTLDIPIDQDQVDKGKLVPTRIEPNEFPQLGDCWVYNNKVFIVENSINLSNEEIILYIKHFVLKKRLN